MKRAAFASVVTLIVSVLVLYFCGFFPGKTKVVSLPQPVVPPPPKMTPFIEPSVIPGAPTAGFTQNENPPAKPEQASEAERLEALKLRNFKEYLREQSKSSGAERMLPPTESERAEFVKEKVLPRLRDRMQQLEAGGVPPPDGTPQN